MTGWVLLIRHASAGSRRKWDRPDNLRPLDKKGRKQAEALAGSLHDALDVSNGDIAQVLSSPFKRCIETVEPLAQAAGRKVEVAKALAEGHEQAAAELFWSTVRGPAGTESRTVALCTHGDIIPALLDQISDGGVDLGRSPRWSKGSVWAFEVREGSIAAARYVAPLT